MYSVHTARVVACLSLLFCSLFACYEAGYIHASCDVSNETGMPSQAVVGSVQFKQPNSGGNVTITVRLSGFTGVANTTHGFHVHKHGALGNMCKDTGGHYNPDGYDHAGPTDAIRHVGDLGNVLEGENGEIAIEFDDHVISLVGERTIIGRSIVIHEGEDDLGTGSFEDSKTTGHAGGRLACCVIRRAGQPAALSAAVTTLITAPRVLIVAVVVMAIALLR